MQNTPVWLTIKNDDTCIIAIHAQPGAKRDGVVGEHNGRLKIALTAPPVDGKANAYLLKYLSKKLGVPRSKITILSGESSREKRLSIDGLKAETILMNLS